MEESASPIEETGVVDRFEGDYAVLILGSSRRRLDVERSLLPRDIQAGTWILVRHHPDGSLEITADHAATEAARNRIADKLARLRRGDHLRNPDDHPADDKS